MHFPSLYYNTNYNRIFLYLSITFDCIAAGFALSFSGLKDPAPSFPLPTPSLVPVSPFAFSPPPAASCSYRVPSPCCAVFHAFLIIVDPGVRYFRGVVDRTSCSFWFNCF